MRKWQRFSVGGVRLIGRVKPLSGPCTDVDGMYRKCLFVLSPPGYLCLEVLRLTKHVSLSQLCPTTVPPNYICSSICNDLHVSCSGYIMNTWSFCRPVASPSESSVHLISACPCVCVSLCWCVSVSCLFFIPLLPQSALSPELSRDVAAECDMDVALDSSIWDVWSQKSTKFKGVRYSVMDKYPRYLLGTPVMGAPQGSLCRQWGDRASPDQ